MKNLPDKFEAQDEQRDAYEVPAIIHEGTISTRAQSNPTPPPDLQAPSTIEDTFSV